MAVNYKKSAEQILEAIGGEANISSATHCVTRLRLVLQDESQVDTKALEELDVVKGTFSANGQFQIILGNGVVDKVYKELMALTGREEQSKDDVKEAAAKKGNPLQRAIKVLADVFIPILPAIVTAGLLMGLNNVLTGTDIFYDNASIIDVHPQWTDFADIINVIASTAFTFLPALIGWSAVKRFGGSPLLGIVLGLILVNPALLSAWDYGNAREAGEIPVWNLFGLEIQKLGYQGQVLPVFVASIILAKIEVFLRKRIPDSFHLLTVAPIALLVTSFITFIAVGPITFAIGNGIADGFIWLFDTIPAIAGFLYGIIYGPLVITGMHHTFLAVDLQLTSGDAGGTFLWPILALSNIAQGSAAFAMYFVLRNKNLKGLASTSGLSAWLGITEPALFGVNLRFRFPFLAAIISSGFAGMFISMQNVLAHTVGVGGVPGIFVIQPGSWGAFAIGMGIVILLPFIATLLYGKIRNPKSLHE
ncbi:MULTISPECIES: PTS system trehalose-specific EIIBC component [Bacillaceae]|uniref:Trehalose permease IIC protein n=1 Tax=Alkalicoccobacillus plakortidis TaxID=444060 RepID=A0A9D5DRN8_9BACI|nr:MULTISPECIES: PTS system trehalose-specific EIIBC component [Bacillaceae]KQL59119.1 trehalose permease IIC protein [Alkalicoccobacillus plakortidis]